MLRRTIALVGGAIILILLVLGVRGCLNARQEQAIEDYSTRAADLLRESKLEGDALFDLLTSSGGTDAAVEIENTLNGYRQQSTVRVERARDLDVPDEMSTAQRYLVEVLELRRDGMTQVADSLPQALGDQDRRVGTQRVAGAMQIFLASDTIDRLRFRPEFVSTLHDEDVAVPRLPVNGFVPDVQWVDPSFVADQVNALRSGTGGSDGSAAPGLHGNGIAAVSLGGTTLTAGASASVQLAQDLSFQIQVQNQGENTENDVVVRVKVGEGSDAIDREETIDTIAPGELKTVTIPLDEQPPTGQNVPIAVDVKPVPGEQKTDNNKQEFSVIFTS